MQNFSAPPDSPGPRPADCVPQSPQHPCTPPELNGPTWDFAARRLLAKMLGEFAYEEIISPVPAPAASGDAWTLTLDDGSSLGLRARRRSYGSWQVTPDTITLTPPPASSGSPTAFGDPYAFLIRARTLLGLDGGTPRPPGPRAQRHPAADARIDHTALTADVLADLDHAALEGHQTGHPRLVLNKGRLGFSASDTTAWAPEARTGQRLPWLAAHTSLAQYRGTAGLEDPGRLYSAELAPSPAPSSAGPCATAASTPSATSTSPSIPGSGTRSSCPSPPRPSPPAPWSRSPPTPTSACPSSRSAPS